MANFLNLRCPACGETEQIEVLARIWMRPAADGAWAIRPDAKAELVRFDDRANCLACGLRNPVSAFVPATVDVPAPTGPEAA